MYELTVVKGGVKLQPSKDGSCVPYSVDSPPPLASAPGATHPTFCGFPKSGIDGLNRTLDGVGVTIAELATNLSRLELHRAVVDKTELTGKFDLHLSWTTGVPTSLTNAPSVDDPNAAPPPASPSGLSIFTALREQLGLKLRSAKGPVEVLVIEHIEKPSAN